MADLSEGNQTDRAEDDAAFGMDEGGFVVDNAGIVDDSVVDDSEVGDPSQMVCINVRGKMFLVEERAISDLPAGVLNSLRVVRENADPSNPNFDRIERLTGGFKKRVQGLVDVKRGVEREIQGYRFGNRRRKESKVRHYQQLSSRRRGASRAMKKYPSD